MPLDDETSRRAIVKRALAVVLSGALVVGACSSGDDGAGEEAEGRDGPEQTTEPPEAERPSVAAPGEPTTVVPGAGAADRAVATSAAIYQDAPVVVLAGDGDAAGQARGASAAVGLGAPLLLAPGADAPADAGSAVVGELDRLGPEAVLALGADAAAWAEEAAADRSVVAAPEDAGELADLVGAGDPSPVPGGEVLGAVAALTRDEPVLLDAAPPADDGATTTTAEPPDESGDDQPAEPGGESGDEDRGDAELPATEPAPAVEGLTVLVSDPEADVAAAATAKASGARVTVVAGADPRTDRDAIAELAEHPPESVLAVGEAFGAPELLRQRVDVAATGVEIPGGGQVLYPGRRMAALYGHPGTPAMGVLGEQGVEASITRAQGLAGQYQPLVREPVVPAFEIIATVASSGAGPDGDYSDESTVEDLRPWVDAAREAGVYVVLDLQPGRTDFLTQAQRYEELLREPHVGLALDPEWRLAPDQVHLEQVGSVHVDEINRVATWLADLTRDEVLPQKLLLIHQFRAAMIVDRGRLDTSRDEISVLIHADGFGTAAQKFATWNALQGGQPPNVTWGWKNFIDEDQPTFTPAQTVAIRPSPVFVSYQ
jgi:hypothetical protein